MSVQLKRARFFCSFFSLICLFLQKKKLQIANLHLSGVCDHKKILPSCNLQMLSNAAGDGEISYIVSRKQQSVGLFLKLPLPRSDLCLYLLIFANIV